MSDGIMPVGNLSEDQVRSVLTAATAAPSLHNSQPWRFRCTPGTIELYADLDRAMPISDPDHRELLLACGAALLNLRLAIRAMDVYPDVRLFPAPAQPDLLAVVRPQARRPATPAERQLAEAITHRRTNRRPFAPVAVPMPIRNELRRAAELEHAWLATITPNHLPIVRTLVHRAFHTQLRDPAFQAEWNHWTGRTNGATDGVPARSSGPIPEPQDEWVLRDFSGGTAAARIVGKDFEPNPLIAVIGSFHDLPGAHLQVGQAMQRVLLTATAEGLSASFLSQVVEVADTRRELRQLLGGGLWPQVVLRLGHGMPVPVTPRRELGDVIDVRGELARLHQD